MTKRLPRRSRSVLAVLAAALCVVAAIATTTARSVPLSVERKERWSPFCDRFPEHRRCAPEPPAEEKKSSCAVRLREWKDFSRRVRFPSEAQMEKEKSRKLGDCYDAPKEPKKCCKALTSKCLSCVEGISEEEYCKDHPTTIGCPEQPRVCCMAMTSSCLACQEGTDEETYCRKNPTTAGCPRSDPANECPKDCASWYDGCNTCTCEEGEIGACTRKYCNTQGKSKCLDRYPPAPKPAEKCPKDCASWYDGCNTCTCEEGEIGACTRKYCDPYEEAKCLDEPDDDPPSPSSCPEDCASWFDGCNTCICEEGEIGACTRKYCDPYEEAKCLDEPDDDPPSPGSCPEDCASWFDGCNTCTCEEGEIGACTELACLIQEEPRCLDDDPPVCCLAMTAQCLSCADGVSVEEYCEEHPKTSGCPNPEPKPCCRARTAQCLSCANGVSVEEYCAENRWVYGCASRGRLPSFWRSWTRGGK